MNLTVPGIKPQGGLEKYLQNGPCTRPKGGQIREDSPPLLSSHRGGIGTLNGSPPIKAGRLARKNAWR